MDERKPPLRRKTIEDRFEAVLFGSRWLVAPIYLGLIFALIMLLAVFARRMILVAPDIFHMELDEAVLATLTFIDIALVANLILIVILAGYENFVSKIDTENHEDRPEWMGRSTSRGSSSSSSPRSSRSRESSF